MNEERFIELGLYEPTAPGAGDRLALLRYLAEQGVTLEEMAEADRADRLTSLAADVALRAPGPALTSEQMSELTGIPLPLGKQIWRAAGFPDPGDAAIFTEADGVAVRNAAAAIELFGEEAALQFVRVLGSTAARVAEAMLAMFEANIGTQLRAARAPELDIARASVTASALLPAISQSLEPLLRHHLMAARRRRWETAVSPTTMPVRLGVGFADLVGYTRWSRARADAELAGSIATFETRAFELAAEHSGRVVKTIGDEVMFTAPDPVVVCSLARDLVDSFVDHPTVPPLRAAVAFGEVLPRDGDYFGDPVNRAARAVKVAGVGEILVDAATTTLAQGSFTFVSAGSHTLKGFDEAVELYRLDADASP